MRVTRRPPPLVLWAALLCCAGLPWTGTAISQEEHGHATPGSAPANAGSTPAALQSETPSQAETSSSSTNEVPQVPGLSSVLHGINGGLTISGVHDSEVGWATISTPAIGWSFNDIFSVDATIPVYMYRLAQSRSAHPKPNAELVTLRAELGDVIVSLHAQVPVPWLDYQATIAATAPTGDELYGLTSGRATFDFSNQFSHEFRWITPSVEMGVGDSTTLVNRLVTKDYSSLGPLAHFQIGLGFPLIRGISFETDAYEQLPIGDQKIYTSTTKRHITTTVATGRSVTEDNGFTSALNLPLDDHATLVSYYNRSLRFHEDTVSIGISYVLRAAKQETKDDDDELTTAKLFR